MATPHFKRPSTLEEAVAQLKRDPVHPVRLHVNDVDLEVRLLPTDVTQPGLGDLFAALNGETAVRERLNLATRPGRDVTSCVVLAELIYGAECSSRREVKQKALAELRSGDSDKK